MGEQQQKQQRRKRFTSEEKVKILRRHLVEKVAVSQVCQDAGIAASRPFFAMTITRFMWVFSASNAWRTAC